MKCLGLLLLTAGLCILAVPLSMRDSCQAVPLGHDAWAGIFCGCSSSDCVPHSVCTNGTYRCSTKGNPKQCTGQERFGKGGVTYTCSGEPVEWCDLSEGSLCYDFHVCFWDAGCKARLAGTDGTNRQDCDSPTQ